MNPSTSNLRQRISGTWFFLMNCNCLEFVDDSEKLWKLCETEQVTGYISTLTYANIMYIMRKQLTPEQVEMIFCKLSLIFKFADFSQTILKKASSMQWKDFENAVQSATAENIHADYIITRNKKDFADSQVKPLLPAEFLARFSRSLESASQS